MKYSRMDTDRLIFEHDRILENKKLLETNLLKRGIDCKKDVLDKLEKYDFRDSMRHPLKNCVEFLELI